MFVSGGADGAIKLWDAQNHALLRTLDAAHGGTEITSLAFSRNERYLLSSGRDSTSTLWDVTSGTSRALSRFTCLKPRVRLGRVIHRYEGAKQSVRLSPSFCHRYAECMCVT